MAKSSISASSKINLIDDQPGGTLIFCAAVLEFVSIAGQADNAGSDDYEFGRQLILQAVADALRYETHRVGKVARP